MTPLQHDAVEPPGGPYRRQAVDQWDLAVQSDDQFRLLQGRRWWWLAGTILLLGALLIWAALTPSVAAVSAAARIDNGVGRSAVILVPEAQAAAVRVGQSVQFAAMPQVFGHVTGVGPPEPAEQAVRRTGIAPADEGRQVLVTATLDEPLPSDSRQPATIITSEQSVLDRILGRG